MNRKKLYVTDDVNQKSFYICTPEDTVLQKLVWCRMTAGESQKQWRDILGVLKLQGEQLDFDYLWQWGEILNLTESLSLGLEQAGLLE